MAQLKDLLVNGKSKFLDMVTAIGMKLSTGGSDTTFWNTNGGTNTASEIVSSAGSFVTTNTSQAVTGQKIFNTNTNTVPLLIGRYSDTTNELLQIGVDDNVARFKHIQDETAASYEFVGQWTDTEGGHSGEAAGSKKISFELSDSNHGILIGSNWVLHAGNYSSYALPLVGGTMSGTIKRTYSAAGTPFVQIVAGDHDTSILRINGSNYNNMSADYGFTLQYAGTGNGADNRLRLYADNQTSTQVIAASFNQSGQVGIGADSDTNYRMKVSGASRFEGTVNVTNDAANNGCVMSYDSTEECMKFTFN